jgi:hypothetical protein
MAAAMTKSLRTLALVPCLAVAAIGTGACAPSQGVIPEGAHVEMVQTQRVVLHGTAQNSAGTLSCSSPKKAGSPSYFELKDDATANIALRPMAGVAMLHVTNLATQKTWCAMSRPDGTGATIPGEFASGVYAVDVQSSGGAVAYSVLLERL